MGIVLIQDECVYYYIIVLLLQYIAKVHVS